jgi:hypothetical protein
MMRHIGANAYEAKSKPGKAAMSELESELERLVDSQSLGSLLVALVEVCRAKADNGNPHATLFGLAGARLAQVTRHIERLGI